MTQEDANSAAWYEGTRLLERAITERLNFAFETSLGGSTIPGALCWRERSGSGIQVRIWYVGLNTPELHIARVRSRVERGGHDIPEVRIRERYHRSRLESVRLIPKLTELRVYDNSQGADPHTGAFPELRLILHLNKGKVIN